MEELTQVVPLIAEYGILIIIAGIFLLIAMRTLNQNKK